MNGFLPWPALHLLGLIRGRSHSIQSWRILRRSLAALPPKPSHLKEERDHIQAADWIKAFQAAGPDAIPVDAYSITMSRSSGPGGQVGSSSVKRYDHEPRNSMRLRLAECQ